MTANLPLVLLLALGHVIPEDPPRLEPKPGVKAHRGHAWTSAGGLRFVWWLPEGYDGKRPRNLTVILHGTGLDYRWGLWNQKPGLFRPDDIVVSVDGTSPGPNDSRLFLGESKDAKAFKGFLAEARKWFAVDRVFLYGHSQGGFFVVYFAGEHPDEVAGVVAHASGAWNWSKTGPAVKKVAIAFMHGTADPVVPYPQSPGSRDAYRDKGFELLRLRRLERYNHWPNPVRANEALGWCDGMTTASAAAAVAIAEELLRPKGTDEIAQWQTVVDFSGARDVLRRVEGKGPAPLAAPPADVVARAAKLIQKIEDEGKRHVAAFAALGKKGDLKLDGKPWIGHLAAVREDFRGVDSVEAFVKTIGLDAALAAQRKAAGKILQVFYESKEPKEVFEAFVAEIPRAFLFEGFPPELVANMQEWKGRGARLGASKKALADVKHFDAWKKGWDDGLAQYAKLWKAWKP
jgi:predicted esterase